ncbi:terminase gpA endonuclease subunit [Azospirillum sp. Sh1]|uniref:terminase gpA endonuclease subunit n=1 Tax=Azospirillum sp. Sh1 TaxID=2607285 RepID=UPI0011ED49EA|nr:terminase gpA endonuclease subunit [Azospirillum sp. Sh1]KAA0571084.1 phage terminase large subunit family protein [Azospirillum sp. Sh1]
MGAQTPWFECYADASGLFADALDALLPADVMSVADYAAERRFLANAGGGYVGRWNHDVAPYLVGPMEALTDRLYDTTAIVGPGQCGKTAIAENWFLQAVGCDQASMLWYMPTDVLRDAYVKDRIDPMIESHEELKGKLGTRATDDSLRYKRFGGMSVQWLAANRSNLISKSAPRIIGDEIDAYEESLGDVKALFDVRRQTYGDASMLLAMSHCDRATGLNPDKHWLAGIMAIYADSTRCTWWWPCPRCGAFTSPNPGTLRHMALVYDDGEGVSLDAVEESARLRCPACTGEIKDSERSAMNAQAKWVGLGQEIDVDGRVTGELVRRRTAGFWIVGVMSPFLKNGIGGLARALVKAEREANETGEDATVKEVTVKQVGVPYQRKRKTGSVNADALAERCEGYELRTVPPGVLCLFAAVDIQKTYYDVLVRGFGLERESWIIDRFRIASTDENEPVVPASYPEHWDILVPRVLRRSYPLADNSGRRMMIRAMGYDTNGVAGVTEQAAEAWRRWKAREIVRRHGVGPHGDLYNVLPLKGLSQKTAPKLTIAYPDGRPRADRPSAWWGAPLGEFNPNLFKDEVSSSLNRVEPGPGYIHFSTGLRAAEPPHPFFEELVAEQPRKDGTWAPIREGMRNETLDLMVMSGAVARAWGVHRLDPASLPGWAQPWDSNSLVVAMTEDGEVLDGGERRSPAASPAGVPAKASEESRGGFLGGRRKNWIGRR